MAHVPGERAIEAAKKVAKAATGPKMMESGMGGMMNAGMEGMKDMGGMMMGPGMEGMMASGMGGMMGAGMEGMKGMGGMMMAPRAVAAGAATGAAVTAASAAKHSLVRRVAAHPLVLFGVGLAIGYLIHKYREEIIQKAGQDTELGS